MTSPFASIEQAVDALKAGRMVILLDDEHRENEGDLVIAADYASPEAINFMARFGRGLICLPMAEELIDKLELPMMAAKNRSPYGTAFTISIEAATGVSTGISASDRARTIQVAIDPETKPSDLISPGHIFPLRARPQGVLERQGQTEGSVDLMKIAGLKPAAVICEIINEDGTMSRLADLIAFAKTHQLPMVTIKDLIDYRILHENLITEAVTTRIPLANYGEFSMTAFCNALDGIEHFALSSNALNTHENPLVRIHSECVTGDIFGSCKCDCGNQLHQSLDLISKEGGLLIYLRQEGRGIGLFNKLKAYELQEQGFDTVEANVKLGFPVDSRSYAMAAQILRYLKINNVRLLTNNPAKMDALIQYGVMVNERLPLITPITDDNSGYLKTKEEKLGHIFLNK